MNEPTSVDSGTQEPKELKPGDTISPAQAAPAPAASPPVVQAQPAAPPPAAPAAVVTPQPETPAPAAQSRPEAPAPAQFYAADTPDSAAQDQPAFDQTDPDTISWTASEFISHNKSVGWYLAVGVAAIVLAALVFWLTRDKISTGVIIIAGLILAIYGARQPRQLQYALNREGLLIANRYYPFNSFRSFAVIDEGAVSSIVFTPHKRFGQLITIYIDPNDEEKIVELLSDQLPLDQRGPALIDEFMKRIRF